MAIAQTWNGTYELIADNITNAAVEPGRFLTTDNATGILGDSPSLLGSAPEREVWWTQQWPQQKWRVNCSNMCTGNNSWSGLAACRDATVVSANYLDQFEEQNAPFACYQAAKGDNRAEEYVLSYSLSLSRARARACIQGLKSLSVLIQNAC